MSAFLIVAVHFTEFGPSRDPLGRYFNCNIFKGLVSSIRSL